MSKIKQTIEIKIIAEDKQVIKDIFKSIANRLYYECEKENNIDGYQIAYVEKDVVVGGDVCDD